MIKLTEAARQAALATHVRPNLVFQIEGVSASFSAVQPGQFIKIGDPGLVIGNDWTIGGVKDIPAEEVKPYISFTLGGSTTSKITQQLSPDRSQGSSITSMTVSILDKAEEISNLISPGFQLEDIIGANAVVYLGFVGTAYPQDYYPLFRGVIQGVDSLPGMVNFFLANTEEKKRAGTFVPRTWPLEERIGANKEITYSIDLGTEASTVLLESSGHGFLVDDIIRFETVGTLTEILAGLPYYIATVIDANLFSIKLTPVSAPIIFTHEMTDGIAYATFNGDEIKVSNPSIFAQKVLGPDGLYDPSIEFFAKIDDEYFSYTGASGTALTGVTRAQLSSAPEVHEVEADVQSAYRLQGQGIDLALKIYLSGWNGPFVEDIPVKNFVQVTPFLNIQNSIMIEDVNVEQELGLTLGDYATITGALEGPNNITALQIADIQITDEGSILVFTDSGLVVEENSAAVISFRSQYDTLGQGLKLKPSEVDIAEHQRLKQLFLSAFLFDFVVDEIPNTKEFIEKQIYLPMSCFSVPRKARSSVSIHVGPIGGNVIPILDASNVCNADKLKLSRSIAAYFVNTVKFSYDFSIVDGKYRTVKVYESATSKARIPIGDKIMAIEAAGMKTTLDAVAQSEASANRLLGRYQFGAEHIKGMEILYGQGFPLEIGDIVAVNFSSLKLTDVKTGTRSGGIKLFEVINKSDDHRTGKVTADVQSTSFGIDDRFGTISQASLVGPGATVSRLPLTRSFGTKDYQRESYKWMDYIDEKIEIHSPDWTYREETFVIAVDATIDPPALLVSPALPTPPLEGYTIQSPSYPDNDDLTDMANWKTRHAYMSQQIPVVASADETHFEVDPSDIDNFLVGATVQVHNADYTDLGPETIITAVDLGTNIVTMRDEAGFTIDNSHLIRFIGFKDGGSAYRWV